MLCGLDHGQNADFNKRECTFQHGRAVNPTPKPEIPHHENLLKNLLAREGFQSCGKMITWATRCLRQAEGGVIKPKHSLLANLIIIQKTYKLGADRFSNLQGTCVRRKRQDLDRLVQGHSLELEAH